MTTSRGRTWVRLAIYLGLLIAVAVVVHLLYISHIRPTADALIEAARAAGATAPRNLYVILRDVEQEACIILLLWSSLLTIWKMWQLSAQWDYFEVLAAASNDDLARSAGTDEQPLLRALGDALTRVRHTNGGVHEARETVRSHIDTLSHTMEAENALFRYVIWVVPSIGFLGTVRGIGTALGEADKALAGDIASMTANLGVAFNSTFVALLSSILLMLLMYALEGMQDKLVIDIQAECEARIRREARDRAGRGSAALA